MFYNSLSYSQEAKKAAFTEKNPLYMSSLRTNDLIKNCNGGVSSIRKLHFNSGLVGRIIAMF